MVVFIFRYYIINKNWIAIILILKYDKCIMKYNDKIKIEFVSLKYLKKEVKIEQT